MRFLPILSKFRTLASTCKSNHVAPPIMYRFIHRVNSAYPKPFIHRRSLATEHSSRRKVLPPELSRNVVRLTCESRAKGRICYVYLVGVIHDYPKSCQDVKDVINFLKPQVVFLELCSRRAHYCYTPEVPPTGTLARLHYDKVISKREISEFRVAYDEANKYGAKVILGDRPIEITEKRYKEKLFRQPLWQVIKISLSQPEKPTKDDAYNLPITRLNEWAEHGIPEEIYIDERDQYMSAEILKVAREHNIVVAVVGKGHLLGIQKYWKQHIEVKQLLSIPSLRRNHMIIGGLIIVFFINSTLLYYLLSYI